jgi:hypothetical protein
MHSKLIMEAIEAAVAKRRPPRFLGRGCVLLCLCVSGCATKKAVSFDDYRSSGRSIEVSEGGSFSEQKRFILADDEFVLEIREPRDVGAGVYRFELSRFEKRTLDPLVAADAWRRIEKLGVSGWRKTYSPGDPPASGADGPDWSVEMRMGGLSLASAGNSAYPGLSNPETAVGGGSNSFEALEAILEPLGR